MTETDPDCLFCKIIQGEIPAKKVLETDQTFAFHDINPGAPNHILVIPKKHIPSLSAATAADQMLLGKTLLTLQRVAREQKLEDYRVVCNNGMGAGQSVFHVHLHLLAGRSFSWPPG